MHFGNHIYTFSSVPPMYSFFGRHISFSLLMSINYLLGARESYGPTAQHLQDCPIFFIQLNYVHKTKQNKVLPPYFKLPATRWHLEFYFLFFNSVILHSCIFGNSCLYLAKCHLNTCHPSITFVGLTCFVSIGMHVGIL